MRSKETATDYRYFPEPDLLPVCIDEAYIQAVRESMPELPNEKKNRFQQEYDLSNDDATTLTSSAELADYFEQVAKIAHNPRLAANWVRVELLGKLNSEGLQLSEAPVKAKQLGEIVTRIHDKTISGKIAKRIFDALWSGEATGADEFIEAQGLQQVSDSNELEPVVDAIIAANPKQAGQYRSGKSKLLGFFVGQVMKETGGKANPQQVNQIVKSRLEAAE
jgi:aspartyl-tRNA(Asn)/glutamyl-tRNA(Gln) amidotransferase subunit B